MEYRYYIYRQSLIPSNFNKYDISQYDYMCEIRNNSQWSLNIERNADWFTVIRREFEGSISVDGNDYNALIAIEGDTRQYAVIIHRKCAGQFSEFWKGWFSYFDFRVDMDRCTLSFSPAVWDEYSSVFDQMEIERNVLAAGDPNTVYMESIEWEYEDMTTSETVYGNIVPQGWHEHPDFPGSKYYMYRESNVDTGNIQGNDIIGNHVTVYRRDIGLSNSEDVTSPAGTNWIPLHEEIYPGIWKWVRPYLNLTAGTVGYNTHYLAGYGFIKIINNIYSEITTFEGCIYLSDVLDYFAQFFQLDYESSFLNDDPNPLGGFTYNMTMLDHISNVRDVSDIATKGLMKLKDLLTWIRDTFNAYWFVDSNGDFRIEHRRYFDFGLSYTYPIPYPIEIDMSIAYPTEVRNMRRYEWNKPQLYRFEKLEFSFSYFFDWTESNIEYEQYSIINNNTKTISIGWGTDISAMYENREDLPNKGWVLLDTFENGSKLPQIRTYPGAYTDQNYPNARLSSANLLRDLWNYGRILHNGYVNGNPTTFVTIERLRQQPQLTFPMCCQEIDFNGIFRTPLGDGIIDKAEYEAKTGNLKINLIYE